MPMSMGILPGRLIRTDLQEYCLVPFLYLFQARSQDLDRRKIPTTHSINRGIVVAAEAVPSGRARSWSMHTFNIKLTVGAIGAGTDDVNPVSHAT